MEIKEAIQKAIEGGYKNESWDFTHDLLNPKFWEALGKSMGWVEDRTGDYIPGWDYNWHKFIDYLVKGKTIEDYFKTIN